MLPALRRELSLFQLLFHLLVEVGPAAAWVAVFTASVVGLFALYVGVALVATLTAHDPGQAKIRYKVFLGLLKIFNGRRK